MVGNPHDKEETIKLGEGTTEVGLCCDSGWGSWRKHDRTLRRGGQNREELIGGMVHEMNVPYIIPDLKLPPVGSKEVWPSKPSLRLASSTLPPT